MIRNMLPEDWEQVSSIYTKGIETGIATFTKQCPCYETWDSSHEKNCRFVYTENNQVLGWIALSLRSKREVYCGVVEISLYVDTQHQNKQIGTKLLTHMIQNAANFGYWSLYSAILEPNEASVHLHQKCGFRIIGYREKIAKDIYGKWQNTIIMEYRLPSDK